MDMHRNARFTSAPSRNLCKGLRIILSSSEKPVKLVMR